MKILYNRDFIAGLAFMAFGIIGIVVARDYEMGTAVRMGPGYFPLILGWLLTIIGLVIAVYGLAVERIPMEKWSIRALGLVLGAVTLFGIFLEVAGMVVSVVLLVTVSSVASRNFRLREIVAISLFLSVLASVIFIFGLSMPIKIWPG